MLFNFALHSMRDELGKATTLAVLWLDHKNKQCVAYIGVEICGA